MGNLIYNIKPNDWHTVQDAISKLAHKLGPTAAPTLQSITISSTAVVSTLVCTSAKISSAAIDSAAIVSFTANSATITSLAFQSALASTIVAGVISATTLTATTGTITTFASQSATISALVCTSGIFRTSILIDTGTGEIPLRFLANNDVPAFQSAPFLRTGGGGSLHISTGTQTAPLTGTYNRLFLQNDKSSDIAMANGGGKVSIGWGEDVSSEKLAITNSKFFRVFYFDGVAYTNDTDESKTTAGTPYTVLNDTDDYFYVCDDDAEFGSVYFGLAQAGVGITLAAEYYNGSAWVTLTLVSDGTTNLTQSGVITFMAPSDWAFTTVNGINKGWVRFKTTTNPTTIPTANFTTKSYFDLLSIKSNIDDAVCLFVTKEGQTRIADGLITALACQSASISAIGFNTIHGITATISTLSLNSGTVVSLGCLSAAISSLVVTSTNLNHSDLGGLHQSVITVASPQFYSITLTSSLIVDYLRAATNLIVAQSSAIFGTAVEIKGTDNNPTGSLNLHNGTYPRIQLMQYSTDNLGIALDAYLNVSPVQWRSSNSVTNALIYKYQDLLRFQWATGVPLGGAIAWNIAAVVDLTNGRVGVGTTAPPTQFSVASVIRTNTGFNYNGTAGISVVLTLSAGTVCTFLGGILVSAIT